MKRFAFLAVAAVALTLAAPAHAERFALDYDAHAFGLAPVGKVRFDFTIDGDSYDVITTVRSGGMYAVYGRQDVDGKSEGQIANGLPRWNSYVTTTATKKKSRTTTMTRDGDAIAIDVKPRYATFGEPAATEEQKRASYDPNNVLMAMGMTAARTKSCDGRYPTFDGRYLYDTVVTKGGGIGKIDEGGYKGPVLKCNMQLVPIAGYDARQRAEQKKNPPVGEVWFALVEGSSIAPPVRLLLPVTLTKVNLSLAKWTVSKIEIGD
jgi:hypothetical protein